MARPIDWDQNKLVLKLPNTKIFLTSFAKTFAARGGREHLV